MNDPKDATEVGPLRRVYVYNGQQFRTSDGVYYHRGDNDTIRRTIPKVRGKSARRADKKARHAER